MDAHEEPLPAGALIRFGSTRFRHPDWVDSSDVRIAGRYFVAADFRRSFTLTDRWTGCRVWTEETGSNRFNDGWFRTSVTVSPDGRWIVAELDEDGRLNSALGVWEVKGAGDRILGPRTVLSEPEDLKLYHTKTIRFGRAGDRLAVYGGGSAAVFDPTDGRCVKSAVFPGQVVLDVAPDAGRLLTADEPVPRARFGRFRQHQRPQYRFRAPEAPSAVPAGNAVHTFMGDADPPELVRVRLRSLDSGRVVYETDVPSASDARSPRARLSPDGRSFAVEFRSDVLVWHAARQAQVLRVRPPADRGDTWYRPDFEFEDNGRTLAVTAEGHGGRRFDLASGRLVSTCAAAKPGRPTGSLERRHPAVSWPLPLPPGYAGARVAVDRSGSVLAVGDETGRLDLWADTGALLRTLQPGGPPVVAVAFSPDGGQLACADQYRQVSVWTTSDWQLRHRFVVPADADFLRAEELAFSPDGASLLVIHCEVRACYDLKQLRWRWDTPGRSFYPRYGSLRTMYTPDGQRILTTHGDWIDASTGERAAPGRSAWDALKPDPDWKRRRGVALAETANLLAGETSAGSIEIRDATRTVSTLHRPNGSDPIGVLAGFSPDGRRLATLFHDRALVWEVASGRIANSITYSNGALRDVSFGRNGKTLITSNYREVIIWELAAARSDDPWTDLASPEADIAERARLTLLTDPRAVDFVRKRLPPAEKLQGGAVRASAEDLDSDDFRKRERATNLLLQAGRRATALLKAHRPESAEGRERLAKLLTEFEAGPTCYELREVRAVELLEHLRNPAAITVLREFAGGDPHAVRTREAAASLGRLP